MIRRLVHLSVLRRTEVLVLASVVVLVLSFFASRLSFDALPDVTPNQVQILTRAPGLTPEEVERLVTHPVEAALGGVPGLLSQRSISRMGLSAVTANFTDDTDPWLARQRVAERLATLSIPDGVEAPELGPHSGGLGEIYQFTLHSPLRTTADLLEIADRRVAPLLRSVPGVVEVNTWGGERRTLSVEADPARLAARGLSLAELKEALEKATGSAPGESVPAGSGKALLRAVARPADASDLAHAVVRVDGDNDVVRVGDVADVVEGSLPRLGTATADGKGETVFVMAQMLRGENALDVLDRLHDKLPAVAAALPSDVKLQPVYDRSDLVNAALRTVGKNLAEGGLLVVAILFAMLGSLRAGLLVATAIPFSMVFAAAGMVALDIPGNLMSLGAIDFGLVVDGAVVMVEAIFHKLDPRRLGVHTLDTDPEARKHHVAKVAERVARPVFFSVLVILLVYVPIVSLVGVDGKMFRPMALTMIFALAGSLLYSLTVLPALASWVLRPKDVPARDPFLVRLIDRLYHPILEKVIPRPALVATVALALLLAGGAAFHGRGMEFVPQLDEGDLVIQTTRTPEISIEGAAFEAGILEETVLAAAPEVLQVVSRIGSPAVATDVMGIEQADVFVHLAPRDRWRKGLSREQLIAEIEEAIERDAPGSDAAFTQPIQMRFNEMAGGDVSDVSLSLFGEDLGVLRTLGDQAREILSGIEGAADVRLTLPPDVTLLEVRPKILAAAAAHLSSAEILDSIRAIRVGIPVGTTFRGPIEVPIVLRLGSGTTAFDLERLPIPASGGRLVPLGHVAEVHSIPTPSMISRVDAQRRVVVSFNVRGDSLGTVAANAEQAIQRQLRLPEGVRIEWGGQLENLREAESRLRTVIPVVLVTIFVLLVAAFHKLRPAAILLLQVPFATVGGIFALWLRDLPVSISAIIGFIALSGIAVLNGVVLMNQVLSNEGRGMGAAEAAREAAFTRARPVMMTALVAALGFVPMMLATGIGAEVQRPLATVVVGGLVTSTLLTLIILPTLYPWLAGKGSAAPAPDDPAGLPSGATGV